ncbi:MULTISPECIES: acylphosphatase [Pseudoalteromonas]|uniref:acylphosphatase n=1 Tax=Pseudoalteromonas obscura TaxID=3048491 RepID=A0ABT7EEX0_9GAMM|nr:MULTISPECIES: acylphosphatase [Pseudoalteromonas]MBQ4835926.1 acylphosphatase [Pseudoalteromonas luteoviolacea]MDK2593829.1 acylphosphatase [Pseudoalteromonas sp. P94(2023)]
MHSSRFIVTGVVQGVGFRYHTKIKASALGLVGYAKNLPDRSVEVIATGHIEKISELASWLEKGPTMAKVDSVKREDIDVEMSENFEIF